MTDAAAPPPGFELLGISVVVLGNQFSPTMLHPAALRHAKTVPSDWQVKGDPFVTAMAAQVEYTNGVVLAAQASKASFNHGPPPEDPTESPVRKVAEAYIDSARHVHYRGVGINFDGFIPTDSAQDQVTEMFVKPGRWNEGKFKLDGASVKLVYALDPGKLVLSLEAGQLEKKGDEERRDGIIVKANYHQDMPETGQAFDAQRAVRALGAHWRHYSDLVGTIFHAETSR